MKEIKTIGQALASLATEMSEPSTRGEPGTTTTPLKKPFDFQFNTFGDTKLDLILKAVTDFRQDIIWQRRPYCLTLSGNSGCGKTHLAKAIYRWISKHGAFYTGAGGATLVRRHGFYDWRTVTENFMRGDFEIVDDLCGDWFVVIDDIGAEYDPKGFVLSKLDRVLNTRIEERKWTLVTTNLSLKEIAEKLDIRIASRLVRNNSRVIQVDAQDYNLRSQVKQLKQNPAVHPETNKRSDPEAAKKELTEDGKRAFEAFRKLKDEI